MFFYRSLRESVFLHWARGSQAHFNTKIHESRVIVRDLLVSLERNSLLILSRILVYLGVVGLFFSQALQNFLIIGPLLVLFSRPLRKSLLQISIDPVCVSISFFLLYVLIGCLYSTAPPLSIFHQVRKYLTHYPLIPFYFILFSKQSSREKLLNFILFTSLFFSLFCVFFQHPRHFDPQEISVLLAVCCFFSMQKIIISNSIGIKILLLSCIFLLFYTLVYTVNERVGMVIAFFAVAYIFFAYFDRKKFFMSLIALLAGCILLFFFHLLPSKFYVMLSEYHAYIRTGALSSIGIRLAQLHHLKHLFLNQPIIGYGTGFFSSLGGPSHISSRFHIFENSFAEILLQNGVIGLFLFVVFLFVFYMQSSLLSMHNKIFFKFTIIAFILSSFSFPVLVLPSVGMHVFCLITSVCYSEIYSSDKTAR